MNIHVMKFGGSSVATPDKIYHTAEKAAEKMKAGFFPVPVVSAPADITDDLIKLSEQTSGNIPAREYDALVSCGEQITASLCASSLCALGCQAVSLNGRQVGILTDSSFMNAGVLSFSGEDLMKYISRGVIPVITGFQGADSEGNITTLGRGGSDLTAVLVAEALKAEICEFYTDVRGIYNAHPGLVPDASVVPLISYGEVLELGKKGTEVRQMRAISYAATHNLKLRLRSSFVPDQGTVLAAEGRQGINVLSFAVKEKGLAEIAAVGFDMQESDFCKFRKAAEAGGGFNISRSSSICFSAYTDEQNGEKLLRHLHSVIF